MRERRLPSDSCRSASWHGCRCATYTRLTLLERGVLLYPRGGAERLEQGAERYRPYRIHRTLPAPLVAEAAEPGIVIGVQGSGQTSLAHHLGHLELVVHRGNPSVLGRSEGEAPLIPRSARLAVSPHRP